MYIIKEGKMNRPKIIAVDFDDTIALDSFPDCSNSEIAKDAFTILNKLHDDGYYIII